MKRPIKRLLCAVMALVICAGSASCSLFGGEDINSSQTDETTVLTTTSASQTEAPKAEPASEETTTKKKTEKKKKVKKENYNQLTGLYDIADSAKGKRPCAVMVNNLAASLPQYGIYDADVLFEIVAEGGITRLMAIYGDESDIPNVCSVRSARFYYMLFAQCFDAVYLHWGADKILAEPMFDEKGIDHVNGMYNTNIFDRDYERMEYMDMEHTGYLKGSQVMDEISSLGIRQELKDGYDSIFKFYDEFTKPSGDSCTKAVVNFSEWYSSQFDYNKKTKTYKKLHNGSKHMDQKANKQLEFTNLLILEVPDITVVNQDSKIVSFDMDGGSGYLLTAGKIRRISWKKDGDFGKLEISDEDGGAVKLNVGKTYIGVTKKGTLSY